MPPQKRPLRPLCEPKHSAHAGPCPTSLSPALQSSLLGTPLLLWASPPSARSPPPLASPRCPHLFYFSPQPSPPCAVYTSTLLSVLSVVPRRCPQVFASSSSSPIPIHLNSLLGTSSLSCSPHCLSGPLGGWSPFVPSAPIPPGSHQTAASQSQPCEHRLKGAMRTGFALAQLVLQGAEPEANTEC